MSTLTSTQLLISDSFAVSTQADFEEGKKKKGGWGVEACQTDTLLLFYINNPTKAAFQQFHRGCFLTSGICNMYAITV